MRDKKNFKRVGLAYLVLVTLIISPSVVGRWDLYSNSFDYTGGGNATISSDDYLVLDPTTQVNITKPLDVDGGITSDTLDTGQGANELYDMDQNVLTTSDVTFNSITGIGSGLTNLPNIFNQWLNTTDNASFTYLDIEYDVNVSGDLTIGAVNNGRNFTVYSEEESKMEFQQNNRTLRFLNDTHIELMAREKPAGPATPTTSPSELRFIRDPSSGNYEVKGFIWYDSRTSGLTDGIIINSSENIRLIARDPITGLSKEIVLDGIVNPKDDVSYHWGDGFGIGKGDFEQYYDSTLQSLVFDPSQNGLTGVYFDSFWFNAHRPWSVGYKVMPNFIIGSYNDTSAFFMDCEAQTIDWNGSLNMTDNDITGVNTINFTDTQTSTFGVDPEYPAYWGAGNEYGKFWLPYSGDNAYYIGYGNTQTAPIKFGADAYQNWEFYGCGDLTSYLSVNHTDAKDYEFQFLSPTGSDEVNLVLENWRSAGPGTAQDINIELKSTKDGTGSDSVNITYDFSEDKLVISDADVEISGLTNSTGGFATDTGVGWSGTFTVTEGVVTVRQGIIIDVDWD